MFEYTGYLTPVFIIIILLIVAVFLFIYIKINLKKKTNNLSNRAACKKVHREILIRNWTDYFWSNSMRFAWITLFFLTTIIYSYVGYIHFHIFAGVVISTVFFIIMLFFFFFAWKSYIGFEEKAKKQLTAFENAIKSGIKKEINFDGDSIQAYAKNNSTMDTDEEIFYFYSKPKRIPFPLFEKSEKNQPILEQKLEALILSHEYFSICKSATTFNLLNPKLADVAKKCTESKGAGECDEYYYSQIRNVLYKDDAIQIIFDKEEDNVSFKCPKGAKNRKPAMKALKEKLRITERQRLAKIDEHKKFKDIEATQTRENDDATESEKQDNYKAL